jgi:hypothetical protein
MKKRSKIFGLLIFAAWLREQKSFFRTLPINHSRMAILTIQTPPVRLCSLRC